jgi:hypothetical protein
MCLTFVSWIKIDADLLIKKEYPWILKRFVPNATNRFSIREIIKFVSNATRSVIVETS